MTFLLVCLVLLSQVFVSNGGTSTIVLHNTKTVILSPSIAPTTAPAPSSSAVSNSSFTFNVQPNSNHAWKIFSTVDGPPSDPAKYMQLGTASSKEACEAKCKADPTCIGYAFLGLGR